MARARGGDSVSRKKGGAKGRGSRARQVYVYTEGEVTEPEYIDIVIRNGTWAEPGRTVRCTSAFERPGTASVARAAKR